MGSRRLWELINDLTGKIALVSRGTCEFGMKSLNAQNAGAEAVIIYNNVGGIVNMAAGAVGADVTIPSVFMGKLDGELLRDHLLGDGVVNATFVNNSPPGPDYLDGDFDNGIMHMSTVMAYLQDLPVQIVYMVMNKLEKAGVTFLL